MKYNRINSKQNYVKILGFIAPFESFPGFWAGKSSGKAGKSKIQCDNSKLSQGLTKAQT